MGEPLLHIGGEGNGWTIQDACEGTLILGATGSGKTSGSGRLLAQSFLSGCFGGIVLTAKEDETALWQRYAEQTGRTEQLCIVRPGGPFKLNFLDYQSTLPFDRGGSVENTVELFHTILESYSRNKRKADSFWANTAKQLLRNLIRVFRASGARIDIAAIRRFLSEVPIDTEAARAGAWKTSPTFGRLIGEARLRTRGTPDEKFMDEAVRYWTVDLPNLADKTRSIVVMDLVSMLDLFFDPAVWDLFCGETTITPEAVFDGAILVIDLPIKKYLSIGRIAQIIWKHLFQLAVERRSDPNDASRRPVFLWADEAQNFWSDSDGLFQATARSSRCATVYLTQNIPGFYAQVGGELAKERVDGFLANLCTKIFHNNNDPATNHWAAEQLGKSTQYRASVSSGEESPAASAFSRGIGGFFEALARPRSSRVSTNPVMDFEVQPSAFPKLRTGSAKHSGLVDAYVVKSGSSFGATGKHYAQVVFQQEQL
jgi:type IV secretory pathway TraG/TraD family ATPase VirD4